MEILAPKNALTTTLYKAFKEIDERWWDYEGLIIAGSWPGEDDEKFVIEAVEKVKNYKGPILGICLGHQVIGLSKGYKLEKLLTRKIGIHLTETWDRASHETYWHDYYVADELGREIDYFKEENLMSVQFHPEYQSSKDKPHQVLKEFINLCKKNGNVG